MMTTDTGTTIDTGADPTARFRRAVLAYLGAGRRQQDLAEDLGVLPGTVSRIVRGHRVPSEQLVRHAELLAARLGDHDHSARS